MKSFCAIFFSRDVLMFFLFAVVAFAIWAGFYSYIGSLREGVLAKTSDLENAELELSSALSVQNVLRETEGDRNEIESLFVSEKNVVTFLEAVENIGEKSGLSLDLASFQVEKEERLSLHLQSEGSFASHVFFVNLLENAPYKLSVRNMELILADSALDQAPIWKGTFVVVLESYTNEKDE